MRTATFWQVLPALVVFLYFLVGLVAFSARTVLRGMPHDVEIEARGQSILINFFFRNFLIWIVSPLWRVLLASGVRANTVTGIAAGLGASSGIAVACGRFALGGWLFLFSGILDALDGRLARAHGEAAPSGTIVDSVLDRYSDSLVLMGLAWYFRHTWVLVPTLAAILGTSLIPYVRAKAESLGVPSHPGLMQRAERILYLGTAMAATPLFELIAAPNQRHPFPRLAAIGIVFIAVTTNVTAIRRFLHLVNVVDGQQRKRAA
jgi:phosphatidylglycerophosphate synthase